jgi:hypothetical protein
MHRLVGALVLALGVHPLAAAKVIQDANIKPAP